MLFAAGGIAVGGLSLGVVSLGGLALGVFAFGGGAIAWKAALGGLAIAHEFAVGGGAFATHANDAVAERYMENSAFFSTAQASMPEKSRRASASSNARSIAPSAFGVLLRAEPSEGRGGSGGRSGASSPAKGVAAAER